MTLSHWLYDNWIELFGAITGIIYVFLEIRQNIWLWPVGIITSAVYIIVFFSSKFYADMSLQGYYLVISCIGWYWWIKGTGHRALGMRNKTKGLRDEVTKRLRDEETRRLRDEEMKGLRDEETKRLRDEETKRLRDEETKGLRDQETKGLVVTRLKLNVGIILLIVFILLYFLMWLVLSRVTDSPVPEWDSFITSLSIIATWMLARKIYEHWFLWIAVNSVASIIFFTRDLYPTAILYLIYLIMSFVGLREWRRSWNEQKKPFH